MYGSVRASGFLLYVPIEQFDFTPTGARIERAFRYKIFLPGWTDPDHDEPLIRLQSDKRGFSNNAHFGQDLKEHFKEEHWPDWLKPPEVLKAYLLFTKIVKNNGTLPAPFGPA
jgi:hypothetical protein